MNLPPGLTCAVCHLPFAGRTARRTRNGFEHAQSCGSRTTLAGGAWVNVRGVMRWQPNERAA